MHFPCGRNSMMNKLIMGICAIILAALLQGCIAGAIVAGGIAGCAIAADRRSFETIGQDEKIAYNTNGKISADKELLLHSNIYVVSYNRVVLLVGETTKEEWRSQAEEAAQSQPNVRRVFNEITIRPPISAARRSKDAAITANVKTRLMTTTNVSARQIKIVTEDAVVYLMGITTREQADVAAQVARSSTGVRRVVKLIEYINA